MHVSNGSAGSLRMIIIQFFCDPDSIPRSSRKGRKGSRIETKLQSVPSKSHFFTKSEITNFAASFCASASGLSFSQTEPASFWGWVDGHKQPFRIQLRFGDSNTKLDMKVRWPSKVISTV
jgi:hypothetical protein